MDFSHIFGVFSRRDKSPDKASKPLTTEFKYRVLQLCVDTFEYDFWGKVHRNLQYHLGRPIRSTKSVRVGLETQAHTLGFLKSCSDEHFLDFVELIFNGRPSGGSGLVESVNQFLDIDSLPYFLTDFVYSPRRYVPGPSPNVGNNASVLEAHPQIIRRDSQVIHQYAIEPMLELLAKPGFSSANDEFLEALKDYRKGDYRDCVAKCGSSLESVMKVICVRKGWSHPQNADATVLLKTILSPTNLEPFFKSHIQIILIIRNELSSAHGAGTQQRVISKHVANFVINSTASTILLLVEETNP